MAMRCAQLSRQTSETILSSCWRLDADGAAVLGPAAGMPCCTPVRHQLPDGPGALHLVVRTRLARLPDRPPALQCQVARVVVDYYVLNLRARPARGEVLVHDFVHVGSTFLPALHSAPPPSPSDESARFPTSAITGESTAITSATTSARHSGPASSCRPADRGSPR